VCSSDLIIQKKTLNQNKTSKILVTDIFFPTKYAKWRIEEIKSFINEKRADVLVFKCDEFAGNHFDVDYDYMCNQYKLEQFNILIFDPSFNFLNKYNKTVDGTRFNGLFPGSSYLFTKDTEFNVNSYDLVYHIFLSTYLTFNKHYLTVPFKNQCIHLYPGGMFDSINALDKIDKQTHIVSTQQFTSEMLREKRFLNVVESIGGPVLQKNSGFTTKQINNSQLTVCFSSMGGNIQKGANEYLTIVENYCKRYPDTTVNFISVGNCPVNKHITNYKCMPQNTLDKFYKEKVDVIINLETGNTLNGWPLGVDAMLQGVVLITTDTQQCNKTFDFKNDMLFIIKDINEIESIINKLDKDRKLLKTVSNRSQKVINEYFSYKNQQQKIFNYIDSVLLEPSVTTIILTYNQENTIEKAIKSVLGQKCKYENKIFISDDCSTDKTTEICKKYRDLYPDKIVLNINKTNLKTQENYMFALNSITTKYTAYLEGDDYWCDESKLEKQIEVLENNKTCVSCCHNTAVVGDNKSKQFVYSTKSGTYNLETFKQLTHPSSRVFHTYKVKNYITDLMDIWDVCFQRLLLELGDIYYIDEIMSAYNKNGKGIWTGLTPQERQKIGHETELYLKNKYKIEEVIVVDETRIKQKQEEERKKVEVQKQKERIMRRPHDDGIHFN
jgi:glycosyltransferase involved in cell wall biosynthesis